MCIIYKDGSILYTWSYYYEANAQYTIFDLEDIKLFNFLFKLDPNENELTDVLVFSGS